MNTPTHIALALATLGEKEKPKKNTWIFVGAVLPDAAMFFLFFYEVTIGTPQRIIWDEKYFGPLWQTTTNWFNSFPIFLAILALAYWRKWHGVQALALAALLHVALDFPLHNDDSHAHFLPLTDWKFASPVSYWDPNHYGNIWGPIEIVILLISTYFAYQVLYTRWAKWLVITAALLSASAGLIFTLLFALA